MGHLFIARHGDYNMDGRLSGRGYEQMKVLGRSIKSKIGGDAVKLISSTAQRALDSSQVLASELGLKEFSHLPYLWADTYAPEESYYWERNINKLIKIINTEKDNTDGLVMMTHTEIVEDLSDFLLNKKLGIKRDFSIKPGCAFYLNLENGDYQIIPPND